jgi:lipid II:glycine glycyltransferase (peptidoglycan interpeptide bridge formation enzyme)
VPTPVDRPAWDIFLERHPEAHLLQTSAWGELKSGFGWSAARLISGQAGAQVLFRNIAPGLTLGYLPKGPVGRDLGPLLPELDELCRQQGAFALKVEPDLPDSTAVSQEMATFGMRPSPQTVQPRQTLVVDLAGGEDALLGQMHPKTRYNVRLAAKKGVVIRPWDDLEAFHRMMDETGRRDGFGAHTIAYYRKAYALFHDRGDCELLLAEFEGRPLAALMVFARGHRSWYLYGASSSAERQRMPTYLLQWEAMRWARARDCREYDLWGVPDADLEALESGFASREDGLWGVYRFKRGFGGTLRRWAGAWDRVYSEARYAVYRAAIRLVRSD